MNELEKHVADSLLVKAAIVEAVHRFYYDRILSTKAEDQQVLLDLKVGDTLSTLWNLHPNWRHLLHTLPQRYKSAPTDRVSIWGKPTLICPLEITISLK